MYCEHGHSSTAATSPFGRSRSQSPSTSIARDERRRSLVGGQGVRQRDVSKLGAGVYTCELLLDGKTVFAGKYILIK
ncbi:MAG: hypothetical protein GC192_08105 [Bacteroidetes bacterium]|nr:hypothetical protein [Bacteroidota bacterium]